MRTRRNFLTLLGAGTVGIAGCGGTDSSSSTPIATETPTNTTERESEEGTPEEDQVEDEEPEVSQREQSIREGLPLEGLGAYEDQMLEAGPVEKSTADEINSLLEGADNPEEEAEQLSEMLTDGNFGSWMAEFYRQKTDSEDTVVVNENYGFFQDSGPILEIYTVQNGELQSGPILSHTSYGETSTQSPGDGENPQYLHDMRDDSDWAQSVPQDYQSVESLIERGIDRNDASEEEVRDFRARNLEKWSRVMFGVDDEPRVRPKDVDTADTVFEAMYGDGDAQIIAELSNEYDSQDYDADTLVEVEYDGGWNFHTPSDTEMGDRLEGEEKRFS